MWEDRLNAWQPDPALSDLLSAAILPEGRWLTAWSRWRASADLDRLTPGAFRLLPLLFKRLRSAGMEDAWMGRLQGIYRHTWARNQILLREATDAVRVLSQAGIPVMLIKGAAMILGQYHDAGLCPTVDVDILVPEQLALEAVACLIAAGFSGTGRYEGNVPERYLRVGCSHAFRTPQGNEIDLHWHYLFLRAFPGANDSYWKHAVPSRLADLPVLLPSPTDALLLACLHGLSWSATSSLRWAVDADFLIRHNPIEWDRLAEYAEWRGVALPLRLALRYLRDVLEIPIPEATLQKIHAAPFDRSDLWVLKTYSGPENLIWNALSLWFRYSRFCRERSAGLVSLLIGLPAFLVTYWALPSIALVPQTALQKMFRHLFPTSAP
jgi:hypothetical protein